MSVTVTFVPRAPGPEAEERVLEGTAHLSPEATCFEGHFPQEPILPAMALLVDLVVRPASERWPDLGAPTGLSRVKFHRLLRPGDALSIRLERAAAAVSFSVAREGEGVASGRVSFEPAAER